MLEDYILSVKSNVVFTLAICCMTLLFFTSLQPARRLWATLFSHSAVLPRLQKRWYLFGIDTIIQDIRDLQNKNASNRSFLRHRLLGPTYVSTVLGQTTIYTIDPANIVAVTTENFASYGKGDWAQVIARYMGKGILVNDSDEWHASRTMLKPLFRRNRTADIEIFEPHVNRLLRYLKSPKDNFVEFHRAAQMVVLDIVTDILCGQSTLSLSRITMSDIETRKKGLLDLIDELEPYGNLAIELGPFSLPTFILKYRRIMQLITGIQNFFNKAVQHATNPQSSPSNPSNIITQMLTQGISPAQAQGELQNLFFAAFDTSTALLANLFDSIARNKTVQSCLRQELVATTSEPGNLSDATLGQLLYLRATIHETLRLHSPVTSHIRKAREDTFLPRGPGGEPIFVPKGTSVTWSTYTLNRQPEICGETGDWAAFRPERWLRDDGKGLVVPENFMPFGSGPRNCLGQKFALQLISYVAARILGEFEGMELERPEKGFEEAAAVTYYNGNGTGVRFWGKGGVVQKT